VDFVVALVIVAAAVAVPATKSLPRITAPAITAEAPAKTLPARLVIPPAIVAMPASIAAGLTTLTHATDIVAAPETIRCETLRVTAAAAVAVPDVNVLPISRTWAPANVAMPETMA
jgi:hypothetical protein